MQSENFHLKLVLLIKFKEILPKNLLIIDTSQDFHWLFFSICIFIRHSWMLFLQITFSCASFPLWETLTSQSKPSAAGGDVLPAPFCFFLNMLRIFSQFFILPLLLLCHIYIPSGGGAVKEDRWYLTVGGKTINCKTNTII